MFRYALEEGLDMDENTRKMVASTLVKLEPLDQIIAAHNSLAKIIAPVTPISLEATEPAPGWLGSIRRPPLILAMIIIAIISIIGFVITSLMSPANMKNNSTATKSASIARYDGWQNHIVLATFLPPVDPSKPLLGVTPDAPTWLKELNWLFAAALGAVFYVLFTVHDYVKARTFDPRYNSLYVIRFVLGLVSGLVLATVMGAPRFSGSETLQTLGPAVAALLGGFSTQAVYQVLQRLVEVMLSAVRGDNSNAAKAQAADTARKELLTLAADQNMPTAVATKLMAAAKKVGT